MAVYQTHLISKKEIAEGTLALEFEKPSGFEFQPGQYLDLKAVYAEQNDLKLKGRDFSIASAPAEPNLMIATRLGRSDFKKYLKDTPLHTKFEIKGPGGTFVFHENPQRRIVILAGGIGITPFRSMIKHASEKKLPQKIFLFYANRHPGSAAFSEELKNLETANPNFRMIATMTRLDPDDHSWRGERGRITRDMLYKYLDSVFDPIYYIAGPPETVQSMWQTLVLAGVNSDSIKTEEFAGY